MSSLFEGEAKGELLQLRDELDGNDNNKRKNAAKRVVSLMRAGENVQSLFSSMLRCVRTTDLELKKLTYLYLVYYAVHEPEQAIMCVSTFIQDTQDSNPLIRALAVRNMCRVRLESVAENLIIPLKKCLADPDAYVRKTAAFGVAKLYDIIPESVENANLFSDLKALLKDENPMVVTNTTAAIFEINERRTSPIFEINAETVGPLLSSLSASTEWCQTVLLDTLAHYKPESSEDATFLIDRLVPFLKHTNPSVVIGAFKCIFLFMESCNKNPVELFPQIIPPFITLVTTAESEIQYVVLRTLYLFVQKYPKALSKEIRVFFCKYNDPSYVKMEKLNIIVTICTPQTAQLVLDEFSEYCNSVDVSFVKKTVRAIGQIAIKIEPAARRCVDTLVNLVKGRADYALEEAVIVVCDILRKFPGAFESIIGIVCSHLEAIKEPKAKAAGIWILGEYCHLIDNVDEILDPLLDTFRDEQPIVQLQLISSLVKVYISKPDAVRDQIQYVLNEATKSGNVPDVKNRALVYWRLLSADPEIAKEVVVFGKETVVHTDAAFTDEVLIELIRNMGTVAGVMHVVPSDFAKRVRYVPGDDQEYYEEESARSWHQVKTNIDNIIDLFADCDESNYYLRIINKHGSVLRDFAFAANSNAIGMHEAGQYTMPDQIEADSMVDVVIPIAFSDQFIGNIEKNELQIAVRTSAGTVFGIDKLPVEYALQESGNIGQDNFRQAWSTYTERSQFVIEDCTLADTDTLASRNVFVVGTSGNKSFLSFSLPGSVIFVAEVNKTDKGLAVTVLASSGVYLQLVQASGRAILSQK